MQEKELIKFTTLNSPISVVYYLELLVTLTFYVDYQLSLVKDKQQVCVSSNMK